MSLRVCVCDYAEMVRVRRGWHLSQGVAYVRAGLRAFDVLLVLYVDRQRERCTLMQLEPCDTCELDKPDVVCLVESCCEEVPREVRFQPYAGMWDLMGQVSWLSSECRAEGGNGVSHC